MSPQSARSEAKFAIFIIIWILGSAVIGTLHYVSEAGWMNWIIFSSIVVWGGFLLWLYPKA